MGFLEKMTIKARLVMLVGLMVALMLLLSVLQLQFTRDSNEHLRMVYDEALVPTGDLAAILDHVMNARIAIMRTLADPVPEQIQTRIDEINEDRKEVGQHWQVYMATSLSLEEKRLAEKFAADLGRLDKDGLEPVLRLLREGNMEAAGNVSKQFIESAYPPVKDGVEALIKLQLDSARQEFSEAENNYMHSRNMAIVCLAAAAGIAIFLAFLIVRGIGRAVADVERAAQRLAEGDLTSRVSYTAKDELGRVARAFNQMADKFKGTIGEVSGATSQLAAAAEELSAISAETNQGISQQQAETDQVATAMNEMSATVQEVAHNAAQAANATQGADAEAQSGKQVVKENIDAINALATEVEGATQVIQKLEAESASIGTVIDVIKGIAEQTNLLALNAAIEAARAGEQGRGFAVVADEVRTLASRTQQSTQEIQQMIQRLQTGTSEAVKVMVQGRSQAQGAVKQAAQAGESLESITRAVTSIADMNTRIASAAEEQSAVVNEINRNIVTISQGGQQTSLAAQQTMVASEDLARLAAQLQGVVGQFRV